MKRKKTLRISTISKDEFWRRLKTRRLERVDAIRNVEAYFQKRRGFVFRAPPPGTPVIHLVSGGVESTVLWAIMLEKYHLQVYPLFLHRGLKRWKKEKQAVDFFAQYFKKRYPKEFHEPLDLNCDIIPPAIEKMNNNPYTYYHPDRILESYKPQSGISVIFSQGGLPAAYPLYGLAYARHLWDHLNVKIDYYFNGVAPGDGDFVASQTFSTLRATMLIMSLASGNKNLQFTSLAFEKDLGLWLDKKTLIRMAAHMDLPLEHTWSCYLAGRYQCGDRCLTCHFRRIVFAEAGVKDKTKYACNTVPERIKRKLYRIANALRRRLTHNHTLGIVEETSEWKATNIKLYGEKGGDFDGKEKQEKADISISTSQETTGED